MSGFSTELACMAWKALKGKGVGELASAEDEKNPFSRPPRLWIIAPILSPFTASHADFLKSSTQHKHIGNENTSTSFSTFTRINFSFGSSRLEKKSSYY